MEKQTNIPTLRFPEFANEWQLKKVGVLTERISNPVDVKSEVLYKQIGIRSHGKGIFYKDSVTGEAIGNKRVFWIKEDTFIVNIVFAWEQAVAKTTEKEIGMIASHRFPMYSPIATQSNLDYLLHFFLTRKGKSLLELASPGGAGRNKTLGQKEFENLKFLIPNVAEQTRIASFFNAIDQKITQLKQKKYLLEQYKIGIMQKLFSQEIRFKDEYGKKFPERVGKTLGDIGVTYSGLSGKTKENFGNGKPYIQYKQIFDDSKIDISRFGFVEIGEKENQNKVVYGDVFFTVSSETPDEIGTASVLLDNIEELYLNSFCFGYRANSLDILSPHFSRYLFRNEFFRNNIVKLAQGSTRFNMSKVQLMKLIIQLPCLAEQTKIANFLSAIDDKINHCTTQIEKTQAWKKGLLQSLFC
jgi:type I restriction enzyme S subunit